ncbi:MAG TPA: sugar phosphate nucleotidyltransferase [Pirellulales bacterium]
MLHVVIMAGGGGARFWPWSRAAKPKQFLTFFGGSSLLRQAFERALGLVEPSRVLVVTAARYVEPVLAELPELTESQVLGEPIGRDTAAAVALAAAVISASDPHATLLVLSADHLIPDPAPFHAAVRAAEEFVAERPEALVTFGVRPTRAETGYGYLQRDDAGRQNVVDPRDESSSDRTSPPAIHRLKRFHEKPDAEKAEAYLKRGDFCWNAGVFVWQAWAILAEMQTHLSETHAAVQRIAATLSPKWSGVWTFEEALVREYAKLKPISIDFAVLEKSQSVYMVAGDFAWDDVGSWTALPRVLPADEAGNVAIGPHVAIDSRDCIVAGEPGRLVAVLGVSDLIVVATADAVLVANRRDDQAVKKLKSELERRGLSAWL